MVQLSVSQYLDGILLSVVGQYLVGYQTRYNSCNSTYTSAPSHFRSHLAVQHISSSVMDEDEEKLRLMRKAFTLNDANKTGFIDTNRLAVILATFGQVFDEDELNELIEEVDVEETGQVDFEGFCHIVSHFLEEEDADAMQAELKEAFRLYDKEGNGYITTQVLREILGALDDALKPEDLDCMIAEIDTDGSGTVDFDEFMEMMTGE